MMACACLLSLDDIPVPPQLERGYTVKQWARRRRGMQRVLSTDEELSPILSDRNLPVIRPKILLPLETHTHAVRSGIDVIHEGEAGLPPLGGSTSLPMIETSVATNPDALKGILDFHTARRMTAPQYKHCKPSASPVRFL